MCEFPPLLQQRLNAAWKARSDAIRADDVGSDYVAGCRAVAATEIALAEVYEQLYDAACLGVCSLALLDARTGVLASAAAHRRKAEESEAFWSTHQAVTPCGY